MESVHHMPGRMRMRFAEIKGSPACAAKVEADLKRLPFVRLAQVNRVTGSVLVHYDERACGKQQALGIVAEIVARSGFPSIDVVAPRRQHELDRSSHGFLSSAEADRLADRLIRFAVDKLVERSAIALIGALL